MKGPSKKEQQPREGDRCVAGFHVAKTTLYRRVK
jgi:hypothetical protein